MKTSYLNKIEIVDGNVGRSLKLKIRNVENLCQQARLQKYDYYAVKRLEEVLKEIENIIKEANV